METFIGASSPLFVYSPCKGCSDTIGFSLDGNSTAYSSQSAEALSISLNFTGSSALFHLQKPASYDTQLLINGSASSTSTTGLVTADTPSTPLSVMNLPRGQHSLELRITPASPLDAAEPVRFEGITIGLGSILSATTKNTTIDDSAWATGEVVLTPGWNMLERDHSNWINTTEFEQESTTAGNDFNSSISWTTIAGASSSMIFQGGSVWAYGIVGPEHGTYQVELDGDLRGTFNVAASTRAYEQVLFYATGLGDTSHNLTLTNMDQGKRLSFDRLVFTSGATDITDIIPSATPISTTIFPASSSSASASSAVAAATSGVPRSTIIGVSVAAAILLTALLAWALVIFAGWREKRRRLERSDGRRDDEKPVAVTRDLTNFLRFSVNSQQQPTFQMLSDRSHPVQPQRSHSRNSSGPSFLHLTRLATDKPRAMAVAQPTPVQYNGKNISQPAMSPALEAALEGRTSSPLAQLKHANLAQGKAKQTTPVKVGNRSRLPNEMPFLHLGGDAVSQRVEFGSGPGPAQATLEASVIPVMEDERSPRRRFFGRAADDGKRGSGSSYGSAKTGNSVGSGWRYM